MKMPAIKSKFVQWLLKQRHEDSPIGDLAGDIWDDIHSRKTTEYPINGSILRQINFAQFKGQHIANAITEALIEYSKENPHLVIKVPIILDDLIRALQEKDEEYKMDVIDFLTSEDFLFEESKKQGKFFSRDNPPPA